MIFQVSASYLYTDPQEGKRYEQSIKTIYECEEKEAQAAGVRWAIERGKANEFGSPSCIKINHYMIGKPQPSGFIDTGIKGIMYFLEWKYDTSPYTVEQLLEHIERRKS